MIKNFYLQCSELPKFYRFEGTKSYSHFDFTGNNFLKDTNQYVYFSRTFKHHQFYTARRLRQLINQEVLEDTGFSVKKSTIINPEHFKTILQLLESTLIDERQVSIEFTTSPLFTKLLVNNFTRHGEKQSGERYIEKVDMKQSGGGYGLCEEWLELFHFFTYFYAHQRITRTDLIHFLYAYRNNVIYHSFRLSPTPFLADLERRTIETNPRMTSSFSKYELMDILDRILEKKLYLPHSFLGEQQEEGVKQIVNEYLQEKEALDDIREYSKK